MPEYLNDSLVDGASQAAQAMQGGPGDAGFGAINASAVPGAVLGNLSWQALVVIGLFLLVVGAVTFAYLWRGKKSNTNGTAFFKAVVMTSCLTVFIIVVESLGWFGVDGLPLWLKVLSFVVLFFALFWLFSSSVFSDNDKIYKEYVARIRQNLLQGFNSDFNAGDSPGSLAPNIRVLLNRGEYGGGDEFVVYYHVLSNRNIHYLYVLGLESGTILEVDEHVLPEKFEKIFKRKLRIPTPGLEMLGPQFGFDPAQIPQYGNPTTSPSA